MELLHAIFGRAGEDVKNDSLEVPSGIEGIVIAADKFSRRAAMSEDEKKTFDKDYKKTYETSHGIIASVFLPPHPEMFDMEDKRLLIGRYGVNPFVKSGEFHAFVRSETSRWAKVKSPRRGHQNCSTVKPSCCSCS